MYNNLSYLLDYFYWISEWTVVVSRHFDSWLAKLPPPKMTETKHSWLPLKRPIKQPINQTTYATIMNPVDNANTVDTRRHTSKMRNKTPWTWQNFLEGLGDEELPRHEKAPTRMKHWRLGRMSNARLSDERLPDARPLNTDDSLRRQQNGSCVRQNHHESAPSSNASNNEPSSLATELPEYVVVQNAQIACESRVEGPPKRLQPVAKWRLQDKEALNPRWRDLDDSFKDSLQ